jgi:putative acetyltransferase
MHTIPQIIHVNTPEHYAVAAALFREYLVELGVDLQFQQVDRELEAPDQQYAPPAGGIILLAENGHPFACTGIRRQEGTAVAELKRMYLQPAYRGKGYGKLLVQEAIVLAKSLGYEKIRLDTLDYMEPAIRLYVSAGFKEIPPYYHNPLKGVVYFELEIGG